MVKEHRSDDEVQSSAIKYVFVRIYLWITVEICLILTSYFLSQHHLIQPPRVTTPVVSQCTRGETKHVCLNFAQDDIEKLSNNASPKVHGEEIISSDFTVGPYADRYRNPPLVLYLPLGQCQ